MLPILRPMEHCRRWGLGLSEPEDGELCCEVPSFGNDSSMAIMNGHLHNIAIYIPTPKDIKVGWV